MKEPERSARNFLRRWSQRKRAAQELADDRATFRKDESRSAEAGENPRRVPESEATPFAFDPAALPPIDSIAGPADVRAFLAPGVPEELTRAALRRAWTTDPTIRDFVGIAENQGDFTAPDGVPGFGALSFTLELSEMVAALIGDAPVLANPQPALEAKFDKETGRLQPPVSLAADGSATKEVVGFSSDASADDSRAGMPMPDVAGSTEHVASQEIGPIAPNANRRHGGALPK
jgi:hypothetical protein